MAGVTPVSTLLGPVLSLSAPLCGETAFQPHSAVGDVGRAILYAFTDSLWYRWLTLYWRWQGLWEAVRGQQGWGHLQRSGGWILAEGGKVGHG